MEMVQWIRVLVMKTQGSGFKSQYASVKCDIF